MAEDARLEEMTAAETAALTVPGRLTAVALSLPDDLSEEDWSEVGARLEQATSSIQWYRGDWWNHGERKSYGLTARPAADQAEKVRRKTLQNCASVARAFEPSRRRESLSFSHHAAVAGLPAKDQDRLLDAAEADKWTVRKISEKVRETTGRARPVPDSREDEAPGNDDRAVFDQTAAGDHLAAERAEKLAAYGEQNLTAAGGAVAQIIDAIERLDAPASVARAIAGGRITPQRLQAAVARLDAVYAQLVTLTETGSARAADTAPADEGGGGTAPLADGADRTACSPHGGVQGGLQNDPQPPAAPPSSGSSLVSSFDPDAFPDDGRDEEPEIPAFLRREPASAFLKKSGEDPS